MSNSGPRRSSAPGDAGSRSSSSPSSCPCCCCSCCWPSTSGASSSPTSPSTTPPAKVPAYAAVHARDTSYDPTMYQAGVTASALQEANVQAQGGEGAAYGQRATLLHAVDRCRPRLPRRVRLRRRHRQPCHGLGGPALHLPHARHRLPLRWVAQPDRLGDRPGAEPAARGRSCRARPCRRCRRRPRRRRPRRRPRPAPRRRCPLARPRRPLPHPPRHRPHAAADLRGAGLHGHLLERHRRSRLCRCGNRRASPAR